MAVTAGTTEAVSLQATRRALVIADDIGLFLAVARSLGRAGVDVGVATSEHDYPGLTSCYVARVHTVPPYISRARDWLDSLERLVRHYEYRLIFPTSDSSLVMLAQHAERLGPERLAIPNREALAALTDKAATRELAKRLGVPVADGFSIDAATTAADLRRRFGLPLVLKPRKSFAPGMPCPKSAACIVVTPQALADELAANGGEGVIAERFFSGEGVGVSVLCENGKIALAWQHRRLEAVGATGRSSVRRGEPVDPLLLRDVEALVKAVQLSGVAMFEFRQDPVTCEHVLIEVNARFWGSLPLALAGAADFPARLWAQMTGERANPPPRLVCRVYRKSLLGEFERLGLGPQPHNLCSRAQKAGLVLEALLRPNNFDGWSRDDPRPHYSELRQILGSFLAKVLLSRRNSEL